MAVPYEHAGRQRQKARTRAALVAATRDLMARGLTPTVGEAAAAAGISRTTAYRYFPSQRALVLGSHPKTLQQSLLPQQASDDPEIRLDLALRAFIATTVEWEPQLRAALRLSLGPDAGQPVLRAGRAIGWIEDALAPLHSGRPDVDVHRLAVAIRSATGIETLVWLIDIAGLSRSEATELMCESGRALLLAAIGGRPGRPLPGGAATDRLPSRG